MDLRESPFGTQARHPWELARAAFFSRFVAEHLASRRAVDVLDVGAGDAYLAKQLATHLPPGSSVTCVDSGYDDGWLRSVTPGVPERLRFAREVPPGRYDWVLMLDVLEHVADDRGLLRDRIAPALGVDGKLLISVPAWRALYTEHDVRLGHVRRYSLREVESVLEQSGFASVLVGGLFSSLLLPRSLGKAAELLRGHHAVPPSGTLQAHVATGVGTWSWPALPTRLIAGTLRADAEIGLAAARLSLFLPGLSIWALATRR